MSDAAKGSIRTKPEREARFRMAMQFDHLVAFVSEQAIDAVSVLFDPRFRIDRVTLVGLQRDMHKAPSIAKAIERRLHLNDPVAMLVLPSPHTPQLFFSAFESLLTESAGTVAVNLNTDDAVCACLALQAADQIGAPVFAVETQYDRLVWLSKIHRSMPTLDIEDNVRSLDFFEMHGFDYVRNKALNDYARKLDCAKRLLDMVTEDESIVQRFVPKTGLAPRLTKEFPKLTSLLQSFGLLVPQTNGRLQFTDFDALGFVKGGWLELAVFDAISGLARSLGIVDSHRSLCLRNRRSGLVCEFDIVFMLRNELHIIECKSGDSRGGKFLTHLEGMTRAHGLRAKTMLVSVDRLSDTLVAAAEGMSIACIHGGQLSQLDEKLTDWLKP